MTRLIPALLLLALLPLTASANLLMKDADQVDLDGWSNSKVDVICTLDVKDGEGQDLIVAGAEDVVICDHDDLVMVLGAKGEVLFAGEGGAYYSMLRAEGADGHRLSYMAQAGSEWAQGDGELYETLGDAYWDATADPKPQGQGPQTIRGRMHCVGYDGWTGTWWFCITDAQGNTVGSLYCNNAMMPNPIGGTYTVTYNPQPNGTNQVTSITP